MGYFDINMAAAAVLAVSIYWSTSYLINVYMQTSSSRIDRIRVVEAAAELNVAI
jgi:hypothetical protein